MALPSAKLLKKITPREICGDLNPSKDRIKEEKVLYDLFGIVVKTKGGHSQYGDWLKFIGQFEAVTPDGEVHAAPTAMIPQPFEDMLLTQLSLAQEKDPKASVQFACRVSIVPPKPGKASATGYEFKVTPLVQAEGSNPLTQLRNQVASEQRALPGPQHAAAGGRGR